MHCHSFMALSKASDVLATDGSQTRENYDFSGVELQYFSVAKMPKMHTSLYNVIHEKLKDKVINYL